MIHLEKSPEPQILTENKAEWLRELRGAENDDQRRRRIQRKYNHAEIKSALIAETYGKCAYCESHIVHSSYGDVEHIVPKALRQDLTFEWANLTLSCQKCNNAKGDAYDMRVPIVDPYADNPLEYFEFSGPMVFGLIENDRGRITESRLQLNRGDLVVRRAERLRQIWQRLSEWARMAPGPLKDALQTDILREANCDKEYAACVGAYLRHHNI